MSTDPYLAFLGGAVGGSELLVVFLVVLVLFGPRQLPSIARTLGRVFSELRRASQDFRDQLMRVDEPARPMAPRVPSPEVMAESAPHAAAESPAPDSTVPPPHEHAG